MANRLDSKPGHYAELILRELSRTASAVPDEALASLAERILQAKRVYTAGAGRSGLVMRGLAMRLMHLGIETYVVGETVTPGIRERDLLIIGSGSGSTQSLLGMAEKAKRLGAGIALLTTAADSPIGRIADVIVPIPAAAKEQTVSSPSVQPMGSLFEQSLLVTLDAVVLMLMEIRSIDASAMFARHANLE
ncbi:6-phospho-3-hexuloisomerase [Cohnella laeviribosi]|uniref:6-phospho-3-hexuloisomerase n=1 Tax=Cohnella laeviribosi TaxID=380174 RepID=UPI00036E2E3D|nr:6-phospho-3-hexuloisomerase [Cohnella laeviribosi]